MKNFLLLPTLFASLFFIVNCSNKSNSSAGTANATINSACPAGAYYSNGMCYDANGNPTGSTFTYNTGYYAYNYPGYGTTYQITNINLMKQLYKLGMGVCDRGSNNYGQANCDYYIQGQTDLIIQLPQGFSTTTGSQSSAIITIFAKPKYNPTFNYQASGSWWSLAGAALGIYIPDTKYYSGAYRNPLQIQAQLSPINNNQGFSASGYGDFWTGYNQTLVTIEVLSGSSQSSSIDFSLKIGGQEAARGRMYSCQNVNCGI
jgi:hypothetical protein